MTQRIRIVIVFFAILSSAQAVRAQAPAASRLLSLVSLEHRLDGVDVPMKHDMFAYLPFFVTSNKDMLTVAAGGVLWEEGGLQLHRAARQHIGAVEGLFGGLSLRPAGAPQEVEFDFEAHDREFQARMAGPLQEAIKQGALAAIEKTDVFQAAQRGFGDGFKDSFAAILDTQAEEYRIRAELANLQDVLWNAAGRLARSGAKASPLDSNEVTVKLRIERRRGFTVVVHNQSSRDLHHVTLVASAKKAPVQVSNPGADRLLGGLTAAAIGEDDPARIRKSGEGLAKSAEAHYALRNRPARVLLHVETLPAGKELSTVFVGSTMEMMRIDAGTYWLWSDEGSLEGQAIGGMEELREEMKKNAANDPGPPNRRTPQTGSSLLPLFGGGTTRPAPGDPAESPPTKTRPGTSSGAPRVGFNDLANASAVERKLFQANNLAQVDLVQASAQFRELVAQFPKSPEATEAKEWLDSYPRLLLERAAKYPDNPTGQSQAIRLYKEVLAAKPDPAESREAKQALEDVAGKLFAAANELEEAGDQAGAARLYQQIMRDLPNTRDANAARARLRKAAAKQKR